MTEELFDSTNQENEQMIEIPIIITVGYSKSLILKVLETELTESLENLVKNKIWLPGEIFNHPSISTLPNNLIDDLSGWKEEEFEIIKQ